MKIEYQMSRSRGPHGEAVYIPMVPFQFRRAGGGTVGDYALVDSGATRSFFHAKYATEIGIEDIESGPREEFYGITGDYIPGYCHDVTLVFENNPIPASIPFCPDFPEEEFSGILGRVDFFSLYRIRFIEKKCSMEFMPDISGG